MAEYTNNYRLKKPAIEDFADISDINGNMDIIDGKLKEQENARVTVDTALSESSTNPVQNKVVSTALKNKVDKVSGKGLSTNDYTTAEKNKVTNLPTNTKAELAKKGNTKTTRKTNLSIATSAWVSDSTYVDWPFKATLTISGVTAAMECKSITLDHTKPDLLYLFGPFVNTGTNKLELWASERPTTAITIENVTFEEVLA